MRSLALVSNRLPIKVDAHRREIRNSIGGLASALRGIADDPSVVWYGWSGCALDDETRSWLDGELAGRRLLPVDVSDADIARYYDGFSNGVLWPLFHYLVDKVNLDAEDDWRAFVRVNERFAEHVASTFDGDLVWVHDFQLALVPRMLRSRAPQRRIGFFLHIPFPSEQIFRILPWREEILLGMLGADVIGFQTAQDANHFVAACAQVLGLDFDLDVLTFEDRTIRVGAYPISIDAKALSRAAADEEVRAEAAGIRAESGHRKLLLAVDRLDYTKGIRRHVMALTRVFERDPALASHMKLVQVAVPTRQNTPAYASFRRDVHELVGRVNARFGSLHLHPIHLLERDLSERQLLPLYAAADVMVVTPRRDGMNLVAKEYVACRNDESGVLVLSEFAGAAAELSEALVVNPNDLEGTSRALERAMRMPITEQRVRMRALRRKVFGHDVKTWCDDFLSDLTATKPSPRATASPLSSRVDALRKAPALVVLLDYDGTLQPHASVPELAAPDDELLTLLAKLSSREHTTVAVVSGRTRDDLERWLGQLDVALFAEHGFFERAPGGDAWRPAWNAAESWKEAVSAVFSEASRRTIGSFVEEKVTALAWHYRNADPELAAERLRELREALEPLVRDHSLDVLVGAKVCEVRMRGVSKRLAVSRVLAGKPPGAAIVAVGDDRTDEELFEALPSDATSIHVGGGASCASHRLRDPADVRAFLASLLDAR